MPISNLSDMTWEDVRDLDKEEAVAILPVGAIEAHGPHLPLTTDVIISEAMAHACAQKLSARGYEVLILPSFAYTHAGFAAGFPGTVSLRPETATAALVDIARNLSMHGLKVLIISNSHLDPGHIRSIEAAAVQMRQEKLLKIIFPNIATKPWALRLTDEFKSGACHAGRFESSIVMMARPELVREEIRVDLPANSASLSVAIRAGKRSFREADGPRAYFGYPADATADEGRQSVEVLGSILEEAVLADIASVDPTSV